MSTLFRVKVKAVSGSTVRAQFHVCHPDQWDVPSSPNIALQTIVEAYWNMKMGFGMYPGANQPISKEQASELVRTHQRQTQLEYWLELAHGKVVPVTAEEYKRLEARESSGEKLAAIGLSDGVYYKQYHSEYSQFLYEAQREIADVHLEDEIGNPKQKDGDPDPVATLVFTVKDVAHLFHLVEGFCFDSAMYDFRIYGACG